MPYEPDLDLMVDDPEEVIQGMVDTLGDWYLFHPVGDDEAAILLDLAETAHWLVRKHDALLTDEVA